MNLILKIVFLQNNSMKFGVMILYPKKFNWEKQIQGIIQKHWQKTIFLAIFLWLLRFNFHLLQILLQKNVCSTIRLRINSCSDIRLQLKNKIFFTLFFAIKIKSGLFRSPESKNLPSFAIYPGMPILKQIPPHLYGLMPRWK